MSYGYNSAPIFQTFKHITQVRMPTDTFAIADSATVVSLASLGNLGGVYSALSISKTSSKNPNFSGRHGGFGNVLWYDGHVSSERPYLCTQASSYSAANQPYIAAFISNKLGYLTPVSSLDNPEASLVFNTLPASANPMNLDYYYWLDKEMRK